MPYSHERRKSLSDTKSTYHENCQQAFKHTNDPAKKLFLANEAISNLSSSIDQINVAISNNIASFLLDISLSNTNPHIAAETHLQKNTRLLIAIQRLEGLRSSWLNVANELKTSSPPTLARRASFIEGMMGYVHSHLFLSSAPETKELLSNTDPLASQTPMTFT